VDHQQAAVIELDRHDLQRRSLRVLTEEDESHAGPSLRIVWWPLLEAQAAVLDDIAGAVTGDSVLGRGASPSQIHSRNIIVLSDNISSLRSRFRALGARSARNADNPR